MIIIPENGKPSLISKDEHNLLDFLKHASTWLSEKNDGYIKIMDITHHIQMGRFKLQPISQ